MTELYKNSIVSHVQCKYANLIEKLSVKLTKTTPCPEMILHSKIISAILKRLRYYNGLEFEVSFCHRVQILRTDLENITISLTITQDSNDYSFTYSGNNNAEEINQYFYSQFLNYFTVNNINLRVELIDSYLYFYSIDEINYTMSYTLSSILEIHQNQVNIEEECDTLICELLDKQNCLTYSEFCSLYNTANNILRDYNCTC
jgi:hypothetical protein